MALDKQQNNLYQIKYHWLIQFLFEKSSGKYASFYPTRLRSVQKINDYEKNFFPIFKMDLLINDAYFDLIFQEQRQMKCKVTLYKKYYDATSTAQDGADTVPVMEEKIMEDSFIPFFDRIPGDVISGADVVTKDNIDDNSRMNTEEDSIGKITSANVTVTLWHINSLTSYKRYTNALLVDCNVGTAMGYILSGYQGIVNDAIVDLPDNQVPYQELFLLPYGLRNSFYSLQYRYGIYANGLWAFLDNGRLYILKALSINHQHAKGKAGFTRIKLKKNPGKIAPAYICGIHKKDGNFVYETTGVLQKHNRDVIMGEVFGDSLLYTNFEKLVNSVTGNSGVASQKAIMTLLNREKLSHKDTGTKLEVEYDELDNPYNFMAKMRSESLNMVVPVSVKGVDIESFTPEKVVNLEITDDGKANNRYGGQYCIRNTVYVFVPDDNAKIGGSKSKPIFETTAVAEVTLSRVPADIISN